MRGGWAPPILYLVEETIHLESAAHFRGTVDPNMKAATTIFNNVKIFDGESVLAESGQVVVKGSLIEYAGEADPAFSPAGRCQHSRWYWQDFNALHH